MYVGKRCGTFCTTADTEQQGLQASQATGLPKEEPNTPRRDVPLRLSANTNEIMQPEMDGNPTKETQHANDDVAEGSQRPSPRIQTPELVKALNTAAIHGSSDIVALLLSTGVDVNAYDGEDTALWSAAANGQIRIVELLLEHEADVNARVGRSSTPLRAAIRTGNEKVVELLLEKDANPNPPYKEGPSPLLDAACRRLLSIVRMLLAKGANAEEPGLLHKAMDAMDDEMLECLVCAGADITALHEGRTVLSAAVRFENVDAVECLLKRGANPTAHGTTQSSQLVDAARRNRSDIVQFLLKYGQR